MAAVGRPKWIPSDADLARVEALSARGLTKEQVARALGISYDTLNERSKEYHEFSEAIKNGQTKGIAEIANALYENAKSGNLGAQIWYLKVRGQWREPQELNLNLNIIKQEDAIKQLE